MEIQEAQSGNGAGLVNFVLMWYFVALLMGNIVDE